MSVRGQELFIVPWDCFAMVKADISLVSESPLLFALNSLPLILCSSFQGQGGSVPWGGFGL